MYHSKYIVLLHGSLLYITSKILLFSRGLLFGKDVSLLCMYDFRMQSLRKCVKQDWIIDYSLI